MAFVKYWKIPEGNNYLGESFENWAGPISHISIGNQNTNEK